jgi:hypothetical protein
MPHTNDPGLLLTIKPSKHLKEMIFIVHILALGASVANGLPMAIKISIIVIICLQLWLTIGHLKDKHYTIRHTDAFGWEISEGQGFASIKILKSTVITTFVLFLHFEPSARTGFSKSDAKKTLLVVKDALAEDDYRYLIVKLKTAIIK